MAKESYILLADYAKRARITEDEARAYFAEADNASFYKEIGGKELISTDVYKRKKEAVQQAAQPPQERFIEEDKQELPPQKESGNAEAEEAATPILSREQDEEAKSREEIKRLRQEVAELKEQLRNKESQIADFAMRFADLAQAAQQIAGQAQVLQAANTPKALEQPQEAEAERRGLWQRIFKR